MIFDLSSKIKISDLPIHTDASLSERAAAAATREERSYFARRPLAREAINVSGKFR